MLGRSICSLCCGQSRNRQVKCPADCSFLVRGQRQAALRLLAIAGSAEFELDHVDLLYNLRFALARVRRERVTDLADAEALEALTNVAGTLRTQSHGLIYEYKSYSPRAQLATDELATVVGRHREGEAGFHRAEVEELGRCLRYLVSQVEAALKRGTGWLELIDRLAGSDYTTEEPRPGGLVEGRP